MPFVKNDLVSIRHGAKNRIVQVDSGPFKLAANDPRDHYQGWLLIEKGDPCGEPSTVCFAESEATWAGGIDLAAVEPLDFRETTF